MFKPETYYYNRDHDDGIVTGRVPVTHDKGWEVLMINYNPDEAQSLKIEYGGAMNALVGCTGAIAAAIAILAFCEVT